LDLLDSVGLALNAGGYLLRHFGLEDGEAVLELGLTATDVEVDSGDKESVGAFALVTAEKFVLESVPVLAFLGSGSRIFPAKLGSAAFGELARVFCGSSDSVFWSEP
jgi:hypothetical protein